MQSLHQMLKKNECLLKDLILKKLQQKLKSMLKNPFISQEPLPYNLSPLISALKGSVDQPFETGTTSVCPDKINGSTPFDFFAFNVAKRLTLFLFSSKTLKDEAPLLFRISSQ